MVCYLLVFHGLANIPLSDPLSRAVSSRFSMQPNTIVAIWIGIGLAAAANWLRDRIRSRVLVQTIRFGVVGSIVSYQLAIGARVFLYDASWRSDVIRSFGERILQSLPANALLLSYTDINWNTIRYLQLCEHQRPDVTHLSLQLMPFPWFERQRALYAHASQSPSDRKIRFPAIRSDVSTLRTSAGYATYLREFLLANLPQFKQRVFLDLHAVVRRCLRCAVASSSLADEVSVLLLLQSDGDIGDGGQYHGVRLTPHGAVWHVSPGTADPGMLYKRWEAAPVTLRSSLERSHHTRHAFPRGSWEFAALKIEVDGEYQAALFRLDHWLGRFKSTADLDALVAFVHGMHTTTLALDDVVARALEPSTVTHAVGTLADGDAMTSYPAFDVKKNAAVARMRLQAGLEVLEVIVRGGKRTARKHNTKLFAELVDELLPQMRELRETALAAVTALLPEMRTRSDQHVGAFVEFVRQYNDRSTNTGNGDTRSTKTRTTHDIGASKMKKTTTKKKKPKMAGHSSASTAH